ncbi:hypothetical protein ABBQ32_008534 [Trebouxia sp. C0010 RCD-2024]
MSSLSAQVGDRRITPQNAAVLMIDHQAGLCQLVRDYPVDIFKQNVLALADTAKLFKMKTILTTSFEAGPNGPLVPELKETFADAPYIARPGQINAWDNEDFVKAVKDTGCKKLIMAGIVLDVCVVFPALAALAEGYEVYVVVDACGTFNEGVRDAALARLSSAGAVLINWFALACELQRDWRNNGEAMAKLCSKHLPDYGNLFASYNYATAAATNAVLGK